MMYKTTIVRSGLSVLALSAAFSWADSPVRPVLASGADQWTLTWQDEFDYPNAELDKAWTSQNGPSTHILCSRWRENASVSDGTLKLLNKKENRGGQAWTSGNIWTNEKFQYGYFECRYRYAAAEGTNNSFWLMTNTKQEAGKKSFEIDINEGHYPNEVNTNIHNWSDVIFVNGKKSHPYSSKSFAYGVRPDRVIQLELPITTQKIRFTSKHGTQAHVREFRVYGPSAKGYPDINASSDGKSPVDLMRLPGTKISVSGTFADQPAATFSKLIDGDPATSWITQREGDKWMEVEFAEPQTVGCVQFLNGWQDTKSSQWRGLLADYKVQYLKGEQWIDMATFDVEGGEVNFARDYHVFGLQWDEAELVFFLDGKELRREKNTFCHSPAPIWLSLAIIPWAGKISDKIDGTAMEVDYVRVFKPVAGKP